jgi:pimeloyl-ACP methyl ester carboxylesterase
VLVIPGLDGHPGLLQGVEHQLFPDLDPVYFDHCLDRAEGGLEGMAARAVAAFDAHHGPDARFLVCGESFGGTVALTIARHFAERVEGMILLSTFARYPVAALGATGMRAWGIVGDRYTHPALRISRVLGMWSQLGLHHSVAARQAYLAHPIADAAAFRAKCGLSVTFDARSWLSEIRCPTLILAGSLDLIVPASASRELAARLPRASLHRLPGGHIPHVARATEAGTLIHTWLAANVLEREDGNDGGERPGAARATSRGA